MKLFKTAEGGKAAIDETIAVSHEGRAAKNDPAIFVMALAASCDHADVRKYALDNLNKVCRIATHLFTFVTFVDALRGWGRGLRKAISNWYEFKTPAAVAFQACKYPQRKVEGEPSWSHRDLLRKIHLVPGSKDMEKVLKYIVKGKDGFTSAQFGALKNNEATRYIWAHETAKKVETSKELVPMIKEYGLVRESIPNTLYDKKVWNALLDDMPMTAMIRNIRNMTKAGVLTPLSSATKYVCETLRDDEKLHKARIHPLNVLAAMCAYSNQFSDAYYSDANLGYTPVPQILDALDDAFYKSFKNVEPTGKNILLAVDVSGSMSWGEVSGIRNMSPCVAAAAMAMVFARTEPNYYVMGFAHNFVDLKITAKDTIQTAMRKAQMNNFGGTDAAIAAQWALKNRVECDAMMILSDLETWCGDIHVDQAMKQYRNQMNMPNSKLICVGMISNNYTLADPNDKNSLNVVGFDTSTPQLVNNFIKDEF